VTSDLATTLEDDGYVTIPDAISGEQVARAKQDLEVLLEHTPVGRDDFEGRRTRRIYGLFAKTRSLDLMATHPVVLGLLDRVLGHYQLSAPTAIAIGPGETNQPLHPDDAIYPVPRPHQELVINVMWPLMDFTQANGATHLVPGSHRWTDKSPAPDTRTTVAELRAGTALVYLGSLWHGGGANRTEETRLGVVLHYSAAWLRPVENHVLVVPPRLAATLDERLQELLGYNIYPPFIGYVDGRHPRKVLSDPGKLQEIDSLPTTDHHVDALSS
jgi:ectoine hydroxylase-related dioxygenase (phytanoyl-CoA dioxygenase family)